MSVLVLDHSTVVELLQMPACIRAMRDALSAAARGGAVMPLRLVMPLRDSHAAVAAMPAFLDLDGGAALGVKVITAFPQNAGTPYDSHQGAVLLFEAEHGSLIAIADGGAITAVRTAAVSAVATDALARPEAVDLALVGTGTQAASHLDAMLCVRPIRRVRAWGRDSARLRAFAARMEVRHAVTVEPVGSARAAVEGADLVCTVSAAREPVVRGEWLAPGAHVNAVGSSTRSARELDAAAIQLARLFVDRRESALAEAGDILMARAEGVLGDEARLAEIGDVLVGTAPGRQSDDEVTVFKSVGLAIEDVAAVRELVRLANERGRGARVELGGLRDAGA